MKEESEKMNNESITSNDSGICGYTYLPGNSSQFYDVIVMDNQCTNNPVSTTLIHEFGHHFNLMHTHGDSNEPESLRVSPIRPAASSLSSPDIVGELLGEQWCNLQSVVHQITALRSSQHSLPDERVRTTC